jgi:16S rRNA processing protein RimM
MTTWVRLGVVGRPHGVRGALKVHLDNPKSTALRAGRKVRLVVQDSAAMHDVVAYGGGVLSLGGVVDRDGAERLTHAIVEIARVDLGDDVLLIDVIGRDVVDVDGRALGRIVRFHDNGAQPVAELKTPDGRAVLVPFVAPIVVALGEQVVLAPPRGLFDEDEAIVVEDSGGGDGGDDDDPDGTGGGADA